MDEGLTNTNDWFIFQCVEYWSSFNPTHRRSVCEKTVAYGETVDFCFCLRCVTPGVTVHTHLMEKKPRRHRLH